MTIKAQYNQTTTKVTGYFHDSETYPNNVIDTENETIDGHPYLQITNQQWSDNLGKEMSVVASVFQEYQKTLNESKTDKFAELDRKKFEFEYNNITVTLTTAGSQTFLANQEFHQKFLLNFNGHNFVTNATLDVLKSDKSIIALDETDATELHDAILARDKSANTQYASYYSSITSAADQTALDGITISFT